jgi:hypothetical protein
MNTKNKEILKWSNPATVRRKAKRYLGKDTKIYLSDKPDKKYMVITPTGKKVHFGSFGMEDFTKHHNLTRRKNYLSRSAGIRGNWKKNKYSANNLSRNLLW